MNRQPSPVRHRSKGADTGKTAPGAAGDIVDAINGNPECALGILARKRVAVIDRCPFSKDRELLAHLGGFWYGHVLKVALRNRKDGSVNDYWAALLVDAVVRIDDADMDKLFAEWHEWMAFAEYYPGFAQEDEDVFALRASFEEACGALAEMIRRFSVKMRAQRNDPPDPAGRVDLRIFDVYGGPCVPACPPPPPEGETHEGRFNRERSGWRAWWEGRKCQ